MSNMHPASQASFSPGYTLTSEKGTQTGSEQHQRRRESEIKKRKAEVQRLDTIAEESPMEYLEQRIEEISAKLKNKWVATLAAVCVGLKPVKDLLDIESELRLAGEGTWLTEKKQAMISNFGSVTKSWLDNAEARGNGARAHNMIPQQQINTPNNQGAQANGGSNQSVELRILASIFDELASPPGSASSSSNSRNA